MHPPASSETPRASAQPDPEKRTAWAFCWLAFGAGAITGLVATSGISILGLLVLAAFSEASFIISFYYFGWLRRNRIRTSAVSFLLLAVNAYIVWADWPNVIVEPTDVSFGQGAEYIFTIRNNLDKDAYMVALKLSFGAPPTDFKLGRLTPAKSIAPAINGLNWTDESGMSCGTEKGSYNIYIFVHRFSPKESREIDVTYLGHEGTKVHASISNFQTEPIQIAAPGTPTLPNGAMALPIKFDEKCNVIQMYNFESLR